MIDKIFTLCSEQGVGLSLVDGSLEVVFDDYPTDELLDLLRGYKQSIIEYLETNNKGSNFSPLKKVGDLIAPLSFEQKRLWFIDKLENENGHYNICVTLNIKGALKYDALVGAIKHVIQRHEILRTSYEKHVPRQLVNQQWDFELPVLKCSLDCDADSFVQAEVNKEQQKSFNLANPLALRGLLIEVTEQEYVLSLTVHHIACDGWSLKILVDEISHYYNHFEDVTNNGLPELPIQYSDYVHWQEANKELWEGQLSFWDDFLTDAPTVHGLKTDYPRSEQQSFEGGGIRSYISELQAEKIFELCSSLNVTPFMFCYSIYSLVVAKLSMSQDVVIGTPVANRNSPQLEELIGCFSNTVALRTKLEDENTFTSYLADIKSTILEVLSNQDVPFDMVVDRVKPQRSLAFTPIFQLLFSFHNHKKSSAHLDGLSLHESDISSQSVKYDIELAITQDSKRFVLDWKYCKALFSEQTISILVSGFNEVVSQVLASQNKPLTHYSVISTQQQQMLKDFSTTQTCSKYMSIIERIEAASIDKKKDAAIFELGECVTYEQLQEKSNQVANYLISKGIKTNDVVAIKGQRSIETIAAMLGVLKSGAAYLPLDKDYPQQRLDLMIADSDAKLVLDHDIISGYIASNMETVLERNVAVSASDLAYVLYTSGSTGQPKGVMVSHGNLSTFIDSVSEYLVEGSRWLSITNISFDISVLEIWGALSSKSQLYIYEQTLETIDPPLQLIKEHQITHVQCTPSFAKMYFGSNGLDEKLQSITHLFIGGEALSNDVILSVRQYTDARIFNMYGPTEATVWSCVHEVSHSSEKIIPIGKPLPGYHCYVLDNHLNEQPLGVPGELYIVGPAVAEGYINSPKVTAQKFVTLNVHKHEKAFKSGDKAYWNDSGELIFLGRLDSQVKLRGHRIGLNEIELQLQSSDKIKAAVVLLDASLRDERLVAYIQPAEELYDEVELKKHASEYLANILPNYMLPSAFKVMSSFPLTNSGKVDRNQLPKIDLEQNASEFVAPSTETEQKVANIWKEILELEQISINDNIFELGGHSLLLTRMQENIRTVFSLELSIKNLFESNTVKKQSDLIDAFSLHEEEIEGDYFEEEVI